MSASQIEIEKNVPIKAVGAGRPGTPKYPWTEMQLGDSFLMHKQPDDTPARLLNRTYNAMQWGRAKTGHKYISRAVDGGRRVWRVE